MLKWLYASQGGIHMNIDQTSTYIEFFLTVAAAIGVIIGVLRYGNKRLEKKISEEIHEATRPIHPQTNGGRSLGDLHDKVSHLQDCVNEVSADIKKIKTEQRIMKSDIEEVEHDLVTNKDLITQTAQEISNKLFNS